MSVSFRIPNRWLVLPLGAFACATLAGCLALGHPTPQPPAPPQNEPEQRRGPFGRFAGTWYDGAHSQVSISADGAVTGLLARPATGLVFDRPESVGALHLGADAVRLQPEGHCRCTVVVRVVSSPGEHGPAETLTLSFRVNHKGDGLRVLVRSDRREETYVLTRGETETIHAE